MIFYALSLALSFFVFGLAMTGGFIFKTPIGKLEFASLDPWVWSLAILFLLGGVTRKKSARARWFGDWLDEKIEWGLASGAGSHRRVIYLFVFVFGGAFLAHVARHWNLHTHGYDLTFLHQSLFFPWAERPLQCDMCLAGTYLGDHFSPALWMLAPFTAWFRVDEWIFFLEAALAALTLYWALHEGPLRKQGAYWFWVALILVSQRSLRNAIIWDFREDLIAFCGGLIACVALERKNLRLYFTALIMACLAKEQVGFIFAFLGVPILWDRSLSFTRQKRLWVAGLTFFGCLLYAWFALRVFVPAITGNQMHQNNIVTRFPGLGDSPSEILTTFLFSPSVLLNYVARRLADVSTWKYLLLCLAPYLYFGWRAWRWWVPVGVGMALNIMPEFNQRTMNAHYDLPILGLMAFAVIKGVSLASSEKSDISLKNWRWALFLALAFSGRWPLFTLTQQWPTGEHFAQARFLRTIPDEGKVLGADVRAIAQLSDHRQLRAMGKRNVRDRTGLPGRGFESVEQIVLDRNDPAAKSLEAELLGERWRPRGEDTTARFSWLERP